jgi:hypothetical protein
LNLAPRAGFEPATCRLTVECSTAELPGINRSPRCERGNTNAFGFCQALFLKKCSSLVLSPVSHHLEVPDRPGKWISNVADSQKTKRFGMDHRTGRLAIGGWHLPMPRSRFGRIAIGSALIIGGALGFLPILGFWMLPLGLLVLSHDLAYVRRKRRRTTVWWARRRLRQDESSRISTQDPDRR